MVTNPPLEPTSPADPNPAGSTLAPLGEPTTLVVGVPGPPGAGSPNAAFATLQGPWPTIWPPTPAPPPQTSAGVVPWRRYIRNLAVRPYLTDPPPCPVVVSYYGYPPGGPLL